MKMAQEMLDREHQAKLLEWTTQVDAMRVSGDSLRVSSQLKTMPAPPAPEVKDVLERATALYSFINTKS